MATVKLPPIENTRETVKEYDIYHQIKSWGSDNASRRQYESKNDEVLKKTTTAGYTTEKKYDNEYKPKRDPYAMRGTQSKSNKKVQKTKRTTKSASKQTDNEDVSQNNVKSRQKEHGSEIHLNQIETEVTKNEKMTTRTPRYNSIKGGNVYTTIIPKNTPGVTYIKHSKAEEIETQSTSETMKETKRYDDSFYEEWFLPDQYPEQAEEEIKNIQRRRKTKKESEIENYVQEDIIIDTSDRSPEEDDYLASVKRDLGSVKRLKRENIVIKNSIVKSIKSDQSDKKVETKAEVVAETKAEVVAETKAEVVAETKAEVVAETKAEVVAETKAEVVAETTFLRENVKEENVKEENKPIRNNFIINTQRVDSARTEIHKQTQVKSRTQANNQTQKSKEVEKVTNKESEENNRKPKDRDYFQPINVRHTKHMNTTVKTTEKTVRKEVKSTKTAKKKIEESSTARKSLGKKKTVIKEPPKTVKYPSRSEVEAARKARHSNKPSTATSRKSLSTTVTTTVEAKSQVISTETQIEHQQTSSKKLQNNIMSIKQKTDVNFKSTKDVQSSQSVQTSVAARKTDIKKTDIQSTKDLLSSQNKHALSDNQVDVNKEPLEVNKHTTDIHSEVTKEELDSMNMLLRVSEKCFVKKSRANVRAA